MNKYCSVLHALEQPGEGLRAFCENIKVTIVANTRSTYEQLVEAETLFGYGISKSQVEFVLCTSARCFILQLCDPQDTVADNLPSSMLTCDSL